MEESIKIPSLMKEALLLEPVDICSYSPLALAYMGDAVYEVLVRTRVMNRGSMQVNKMHKKAPAWSRQRRRPGSYRRFRRN